MKKEFAAILLLLTSILFSSCAPSESAPGLAAEISSESAPGRQTAVSSEPVAVEVTINSILSDLTSGIPIPSDISDPVLLTETPEIPVDYVIDPRFDEAQPFNPYGFAVVGVQTDGVMKYGVIDEDGVFAIEPEYDGYDTPVYGSFTFSPENDIGYIWLEKDGLWGFVDDSCEWVVEPSYEDCTCFSSFGLAGVSIDGKWGFLSTTGELVVKPVYEKVRLTSKCEYANVAKGDLWGLVDKTGKEVLSPRSATPICVEGTMTMSGRWNAQGQDVVLINNETCLITMDGRVIAEGATQWIESIGPNLLVFVNTEGATGYYNLEGELVIPLGDNEFGHVFSEDGIAVVATREDGGTYSRRYIDGEGNTLFERTFEEAREFALNGLACVAVDGQYGYIDSEGSFIIKPQFDYAYDFYPDGYARVSSGGKLAIIDSEGTRLTEFAYEGLGRMTPYDSAYSLFIAKKDGQAGLIDASGKWILKPDYTDIYIDDPQAEEGLNLTNHSDRTYAMIKVDGKFGILAEDGTILLPPVSGPIQYVSSSHYIAVCVNGLYGYVDLAK